MANEFGNAPLLTRKDAPKVCEAALNYICAAAEVLEPGEIVSFDKRLLSDATRALAVRGGAITSMMYLLRRLSGHYCVKYVPHADGEHIIIGRMAQESLRRRVELITFDESGNMQENNEAILFDKNTVGRADYGAFA